MCVLQRLVLCVFPSLHFLSWLWGTSSPAFRVKPPVLLPTPPFCVMNVRLSVGTTWKATPPRRMTDHEQHPDLYPRHTIGYTICTSPLIQPHHLTLVAKSTKPPCHLIQDRSRQCSLFLFCSISRPRFSALQYQSASLFRLCSISRPLCCQASQIA